jgi:hypothetical protein
LKGAFVISFNSNGSFAKTEKFLKAMIKLDVMNILHKNGKRGVSALSSMTPVESGRAATSWDYVISKGGGVYNIAWTNSDTENGFPVVVMLQYGHGTGTGGYVAGRDFINPAIRPIFDEIANEVWRAVITA